MGFWYYFWTLNFVVAGSAFLIVTLIVLVLGSRDLRDLFVRLEAGSGPLQPGTGGKATRKP